LRPSQEPQIASVTSTGSTLTITFAEDMNTSFGTEAGAWSWRKTNQRYEGDAGASWSTNRILVVNSSDSLTESGANVFSYNAALGTVRSAAGVALTTKTNVAY
jgi:hypothetical protein